ncbi:MAG: transcription-repair coupling factor [Firmicutes bacterium]|nr:transcription-repair coupling factor [Bacillota bacterium]
MPVKQSPVSPAAPAAPSAKVPVPGAQPVTAPAGTPPPAPPLGPLARFLAQRPELQSAIRPDGAFGHVLVTGVGGSAKAAVAAAACLLQHPPRSCILVAENAYDGEQMFSDLSQFLPGQQVLFFAPAELWPHEEMVESIDLSSQRLEVLARLAASEAVVVVAPVEALLRRVPAPRRFTAHAVRLAPGQAVDREELANRLVAMGYRRSDLVEARGQFRLQGEIFDVFVPWHDYPARVEFFDEEIDRLSYFDPDSQRSLGGLPEITVYPAQEFVATPGELRQSAPVVERLLQEAAERLRRAGNGREAARLLEKGREHTGFLAEGAAFPGVAQYLPQIVQTAGEDLATLFDYAPQALVILDEAARLREAARRQAQEIGQEYSRLLEKGQVLPEGQENFASWERLLDAMRAHPALSLSLLPKRLPGWPPQRQVDLGGKALDLYHGRVERLAIDLSRRRRQDTRIVLALSDRERCRRMQSLLLDHGLEAALATGGGGGLDRLPDAGAMVLAAAPLSSGFDLPEAGLLVLTDYEVYGRERRRRRAYKTLDKAGRIASFNDLHLGDYVVHVNHGIGQYRGTETLEIDGVHRDYLVVEYAGGDRLYVPTDQIDLLQKYVGVEGIPPRLHKLGGSEWSRVKARVKESLQDMAEKLLKLYAQREHLPGHAFGPDTPWQREFEESFPYPETPDQLRAVEEIKRDMEAPRPMDRLLCGDVGYGKTEVALRAAFKAVMDGKQVAMLVPTTLLAQQHYNTFRERLEGFPVTVGVLSRFQTAREMAEIKEKLATGSLDIVIGTHRLLQKDVQFKNLGLVIIDEEQRFGVAQKERLKELRTSVDVLTLTATPIPRTLHMSLVQVRDMSVIETPPEDRFPVRTYVLEYDPEVIRAALQRELGRHGQVYFVYNQVRDIDRMAGEVQRLVPGARVGVAHGQMDENELEEVMMRFYQGELDILVCSTIIESGLDIPNVNTLVVYDADRLGLAQLYQLRGRVGRSNRVAYAYFTYRKEKVLQEEAERRLQAIQEFTELGSGFKVAMRDLEIRGAGNILGPQQHGFIAAVGFELYTRLLRDAVAALRGESKPTLPPPALDLNVEAYLPEEYIRDGRQKVEMYKKIAAAEEPGQIDEIEDEMLDRFGDLPPAAANLLTVARAKLAGRRLGVAQVGQEGETLVIRFHPGVQLHPQALAEAISRSKGQLTVYAGEAPVLRILPPKGRGRGATTGMPTTGVPTAPAAARKAPPVPQQALAVLETVFRILDAAGKEPQARLSQGAVE